MMREMIEVFQNKCWNAPKTDKLFVFHLGFSGWWLYEDSRGGDGDDGDDNNEVLMVR